MNKQILVGVGGLLLQGNNVLMLHRAPGTPADNVWWWPGGHVDGGETIRQALAREFEEEIGVTIDPSSAQFIHVTHSNYPALSKEYITFNFLITQWQGEPVIKEPTKHDQLAWFDLDNLPDDSHKLAKLVAKAYREGSFYSEFGW